MLIGWFARIFVAAAIVGVIGFDSISLVAAHVGAQEDADNAATQAAAAWQSAGGARSPSLALSAAARAADSKLVTGEVLVADSISVATDGTLTLRIRRTTERTLVAHDIGPLRHVVTFDTTGHGTPPPATA